MRIVTGCSRSGTSFVSQLLHELGGDFGDAEGLIDGDEWNAAVVFGNAVADHRSGAGGNRLIDEARAVGLDPCQGEEHVARLHHTAVHGNACDRNIGMLRADHGVPAEKVA